MKRFALIFIFILLTLGTIPALADYLTTFHFYDASNNSVLNYVNVTVNGTTYILNSGDNLTLAGGNYTLVFKKDDYGNKTLGIELTSNTTITIYLEPISNESSNSTALPSLSMPTFPSKYQSYAPNYTNLDTEISNLFSGNVGYALAAIFLLGLIGASIQFHRRPAVIASVAGVSVIYLGYWIRADWSILWVLIALLLSATILRTFGRYEG